MNRRWLRLLCAGALALTSLLAHAQYSWLDDKGTRVFSDRPPPPGTPPSRILKAPGTGERRCRPLAQAADPVIPDWKKRDEELQEAPGRCAKGRKKQPRQRAMPCASTSARRDAIGRKARTCSATRPPLAAWTNKGQVRLHVRQAPAGEQERLQK
jgi:hypothetical protein